ncbi:integrase [Steroidobacter agaridevorans]|uniref:Integrase n=1 Tax=Steroidobacter agaridevorans TaxID=2695856 RepID=A0A829YKU1_9GAMM|nr:site-specific integrase [Steroidobacter agaridevorans]GFE83412.1 integrase [Steroidobacter agaridevorans]
MAKITKRGSARLAPVNHPLVAHSHVLALDPEALHARTEAAIDAIYAQSESANTLRSYATALRYWAAWFQLRYRQTLTLPVPIAAVLQFVVDHVEREDANGAFVHELSPAIDAALVAAGFKASLGLLKLSTVRHRLAVLSKAHQLKALDNPVRAAPVVELVRRVRKLYASRGRTATSQPALTRPPLEAMLATCTDGLIGLRDRALLLVGWSTGGRRRSELTRLTVEQVMRVEAALYVFRLSQSKTNQAGEDDDPHAVKPIAGVAALALTAWLEAAQLTSGALFRRVRGSKVGGALTPQAVRCIVQRRARLAGLTDVRYSAHSIRSGFMTEAGRSGMHLRDAMALSEHRTPETALKYFQPGAALASGVNKLLDGLDRADLDGDHAD